MGLQYAGLGMMAAIRNTTGATKPGFKLWETETPCGGGRARDCGTGPGTRNNSWAWGQGQWAYMRAYIEAGASLYSQWNMVLDDTGRSGWGWSQCSPVTVFTHGPTPTVAYEGSYWATKHYSYFVDAGAKVLLVTGDNSDCRTVNGACGCERGCAQDSPADQFLAFRNPSGTLVILAMNANDAPRPIRVAVDGVTLITETLPPNSFSTFVVGAGGTSPHPHP